MTAEASRLLFYLFCIQELTSFSLLTLSQLSCLSGLTLRTSTTTSRNGLYIELGGEDALSTGIARLYLCLSLVFNV